MRGCHGRQPIITGVNALLKNDMKQLNSMTNRRNSMVKLVAICCALFPTIGFGQIVSNLGQSSGIAATIGNTGFDLAHATAFTTGNNSSGYTLTEVEISIDDFTGSPTPLEMTIRNDSGTFPGTTVGTLTGSAVRGATSYTHTGLLAALATACGSRSDGPGASRVGQSAGTGH